MDAHKYRMTGCSKAGVKIHESANTTTANPFAQWRPETSRPVASSLSSPHALDSLELDVRKYSLEDLLHLFQLNNVPGKALREILTEDTLKQAKRIVARMHPDKSRLPNQYFVFFSEAYAELERMYQHHTQNQVQTVAQEREEFVRRTQQDDRFAHEKQPKDGESFKAWFNQQFEEKKRETEKEDPGQRGYDEWLKSDADILFAPTRIAQNQLGSEMNRLKQQLIIPRFEAQHFSAPSSAGGSSLITTGDHFGSDRLFGKGGFSDLRQAYAESVMAITEDELLRRTMYSSVDQLRRERDQRIELRPMQESMQQLFETSETVREFQRLSSSRSW